MTSPVWGQPKPPVAAELKLSAWPPLSGRVWTGKLDIDWPPSMRAGASLTVPRAPLPRASPEPGISAGAAQPVQLVNPSTVQFAASTDHAAVQNTVAVVARYLLEILDPAGALAKTVDLGKPAPDATGQIAFTGLVAAMNTLPPATYTVRVVAEGPGGQGRSALSDPFSVQVRAPAAPAGKPVPK